MPRGVQKLCLSPLTVVIDVDDHTLSSSSLTPSTALRSLLRCSGARHSLALNSRPLSPARCLMLSVVLSRSLLSHSSLSAAPTPLTSLANSLACLTGGVPPASVRPRKHERVCPWSEFCLFLFSVCFCRRCSRFFFLFVCVSSHFFLLWLCVLS